jgi:ribose/xylose/arabinose/galactoside ABC-type transport system permease subunit
LSVDAGVAEVSRNAWRLRLSSLVSSLLFSSRFVTIWIATGVLLIVCQIVAPQTLSSDSWSVMLPLAAIIAVAAMGQMLVVMTGGIDLSMVPAARTAISLWLSWWCSVGRWSSVW